MQFFKIFFASLIFSSSLFLVGCQSTNSDTPVVDTNQTTPPIDTNATKEPANISFVNGNVISVVSSGEKKDIYVRAFNSNGTLDTEGQITVQYPNKNIVNGVDVGTFSPNTATIADGIAHFVYTAPADLQARVDAGDLNTTFTFFSATDANVTTSLRVDYKPSSSIGSGPSTLSKLVLSESNITVSTSGEKKTLTLFAYTDQNTTNISLEVLYQVDGQAISNGIDVGYMPASLNVVNGRVSFSYTAPDNLLDTSNKLASALFTLYDKDNPGITTILKVNFTPNTPTLRAERPTITLTDNGQNETITILAFDENKQAFSSGTIFVQYPDAIGNGTISGGTFAQNEAAINNGKAVFNFTGPTPLETIATQTFVFKYKENPSVSTSLNMQYSPSLPQIASLAVNEVNTTITQDTEIHKVIINALDANGNFVNSGTINVKFPAIISSGVDVGSFESFSVNIDKGQAVFNYTGPANLLDTKSKTSRETFTFSDAADATKTVDWNVNFLPGTQRITIPTPSITVTKDGQETEVLVLAFDENNQSLTSGHITVSYPPEIVSGSVDGGRFEAQEVEIVNGEAKFKFLGPNKLVGLNDLTFQFAYKENPLSQKQNLMVSYIPDIPNIVLPFSDTNLTTNSQAVDIEVSVLSSITNAAYNEGNISVIYPESTKDGVDVGYFETTIVPIVNGKATFRYVGPKDLKKLVDANITNASFWFYHSSYYNKDNKITFNYTPDSNIVILEDYNLTSTLTSSTLTMGLESSKNITFYLKNDTGVLVPDENVTQISIKLLNPALGDLKDSEGTVDKNLTIVNNSTVGVILLSKRLSGVIPIKVEAQFNDVNSDPQTIEKVFNVIVLSGPPTAMSLSYVSTSQDTDTAKFKEKINVLLTDKYNNPVSSKPGLSVSLISGYHNDTSGPLGYMYHTKGATVDGDKLKVKQGIVSKIEITNSGGGYTKAPAVSLAGGDGQFDATAVLNSRGSINAINLVSAGQGYTSEPTVSINGVGYGFVGTAHLDTTNGTFESITVENGGAGYTAPPTITGVGGSGLVANVVLAKKGSIKDYTIVNGASGFNVGDQLKVLGDGSGAVIKVTDVDGSGAIKELSIFNKGSNYTYANIDTTVLNDDTNISDTSVRIDLTIGYAVDKVILSDGGSGYTSSTLNFSAESGATPAVASGVLSYPLSSISVDNSGSGYDSRATVSISGDGTGASATADVRYPVDYVTINNGGSGYVDGTSLTVNNTGTNGSGFAAKVKVFGNFNTLDPSNEYAGTFGDGYTYGASGKWDFDSVAANELTLSDQFEGNATSGLGFAIGNNHRQDRCISGREWVCTANIIGDPVFDENGLASFEVVYDYYMVAKDILVMVNLVGAQNDLNKTIRLGESIKHTLRGHGLKASVLNVPAGVSYATYRIYVDLKDTAEPLRNANFVYSVSASTGITIHYIRDSMDLGIDECGTDTNGNKLEGRAYVDITLSSAVSGTVSLINLAIAKEFK